jgi:two-component system, LuxR family, response regulator FixJ
MASGRCAALTGRTHGCTDQPANVKKTLANSEPSTHGTSRRFAAVPTFVRYDPAVRSSLKFSLEIEGFSVRLYSDAHELLSESDLPATGCLLIDYYMPTMNGLELLARLRDRGVSIPAMVITSYPNSRLRDQIAAAGVPLIEMPFLGNVLTERIREALDRHGS